MIHFVVTAVSRRQSSQVSTIINTYVEGKPDPKTERRPGAEWEEVEFQVQEEKQPRITVANISGDAFLINQPCKLIINNPELFGSFKVGDVVPFATPLNVAPAT